MENPWRHRPGDAQLDVGIRDRGRAAGDLQPHQLAHHIAKSTRTARDGTGIGGGKRKAFASDHAVEIGGAGHAWIDAHRVKINVQFLGNQGRLHGICALP